MKQTNQQGFSLAELLIGLAVSIIIITTAVTLKEIPLISFKPEQTISIYYKNHAGH